MRIYLDDDSAADLLIRFLRTDGHDVAVPSDFGRAGDVDPLHLTEAIRSERVFITQNHDDFEVLHQLVLQSSGHHPGILVIRRDNNPRRDMTIRGAANAVQKLAGASAPIADQFIVLNHWR